MLSVATSIDTLAIGVTLAFLKVFIMSAVIIIGTVTFFISVIGSYIGHRLGHFFENQIEIIGGLVLIGIGVRILREHMI
jgi:putative Mn2+ efflux pump MntP